MNNIAQKLPLKVLLASPRGFCAGVDRAIEIVLTALEKFGRPVYVRHEIVHNKFVVQSLEAKGAIFVEELDEVPTGVPVVFSAHGVPKAVYREADDRQLLYVDATCPLVSKVHREAERHFKNKKHIVLIGHSGHPEVIGTMGQLPEGSITLIEDIPQAEAFAPLEPDNLGVITQTTLSTDDTAGIMAVLQRRFPSIQTSKKEDICYATTNRQAAVRAIAERCDLFLVIGAPNSSNSVRLVEVAKTLGVEQARLIQTNAEIDWSWVKPGMTIGLSAGASAPEILVQDVLSSFRERYDLEVEEVSVTIEDVHFKLPKVLAS